MEICPGLTDPQKDIGARSCTIDQQAMCSADLPPSRCSAIGRHGGLTTWRADPGRSQGVQQGIPKSSNLASWLGCPHCLSTRWGPTCEHRLRGLPNQLEQIHPCSKSSSCPGGFVFGRAAIILPPEWRTLLQHVQGCTTHRDRLKNANKRSPSCNREITGVQS